MAWTSENWIQDSNHLSGYPTPAGTEYPVGISISGFVDIWSIDETIGGYPHPAEGVSAYTSDEFVQWWLFNDKVGGYPHPAEFPPVKSGYPVFTAFSMNGIGADFRQISRSRAISLPEQIQFKFDIKEHLDL